MNKSPNQIKRLRKYSSSIITSEPSEHALHT